MENLIKNSKEVPDIVAIIKGWFSKKKKNVSKKSEKK